MGSYSQALQYKQGLKDEELQGKIGELVDNRKSIQAKLPTLLDEKGQPTPQYHEAMTALTQNAQALRELYHPQNNPNAIQSFGHLLTDALHITKAEDRAKKAQTQQAAGAASDQNVAQGVAAAAPLSPEQISDQDTKAKIAQQNAMSDATIDWLKKNNAPKDIIDRAVATRGGVLKEPIEKYMPQLQVTKDATGKDHYWRVPLAPGEAPEEVDFNGQAMVPKTHPSTAAEAQWVRATYGKDLEQLSPEQATEAVSRYQQLRTPTSTSTGESLVYDQNNQPHVFTHTSTSKKTFPGSGTRPGVPSAPSAAATPYTGTAHPPGKDGQVTGVEEAGSPPPSTTPRKSSTAPKQPKSPIGPAIEGFTKLSPEVTNARKDVIAATKIDSLANQALASHEPVQQRQLALAMIRGMAGRVNMQEFQQYTTKMGVENTIDGLIKGIESGQMPDGVIKQLVDASHANLKASKDALQVAIQGSGGTPESGQSGSDPEVDEIIKALNKKKTP